VLRVLTHTSTMQAPRATPVARHTTTHTQYTIESVYTHHSRDRFPRGHRRGCSASLPMAASSMCQDQHVRLPLYPQIAFPHVQIQRQSYKECLIPCTCGSLFRRASVHCHERSVASTFACRPQLASTRCKGKRAKNMSHTLQPTFLRNLT
jgi:hypothetical protein